MTRNNKKKILIVSLQPPIPTHGGGQLLLNKSKYLSKYYDLFLVTKIKNQDKKYFKYFTKYFQIIYISKKNRFLKNPFLYVFNSIIKPHYHILKLIRKNKFHAIQLEYTLAALYFILLKPLIKCRIYLTEVDVSYMSLKTKMTIDNSQFHKIKYYFVKIFEIILLKFIPDKILVWGNDDMLELKKYIKKQNKILIIPPIIEKKTTWNLNSSNKFLFIGSNHKPNIESLKYILKYYWPVIRKYFNSPKLIIIGNINFKTSNLDIIKMGFMDDISTLMLNSRALLAPIVWGAGIKVKLLDALSMGIPIITNKNGIINFDNFNLMEIISDNGIYIDDFIIKYKDYEYLKRLSKKEIVYSWNYSPEKVIPNYLELYDNK